MGIGRESKDNDWGAGRKIIVYGGSVVVACGLFVVAAPFTVKLMGFTAAGIAGGTFAAKMMSVSAAANGGGVAAGGVVATLQSVGAAGLGAKGAAVVGGAGASIWAGMTYVGNKIFGSDN